MTVEDCAKHVTNWAQKQSQTVGLGIFESSEFDRWYDAKKEANEPFELGIATIISPEEQTRYDVLVKPKGLVAFIEGTLEFLSQ